MINFSSGAPKWPLLRKLLGTYLFKTPIKPNNFTKISISRFFSKWGLQTWHISPSAPQHKNHRYWASLLYLVAFEVAVSKYIWYLRHNLKRFSAHIRSIRTSWQYIIQSISMSITEHMILILYYSYRCYWSFYSFCSDHSTNKPLLTDNITHINEVLLENGDGGIKKTLEKPKNRDQFRTIVGKKTVISCVQYTANVAMWW